MLRTLTVAALALMLLGCGGTPAKNNGTAVNVDVEGSKKASDEETLGSVRDALYTRADLESCQGTVRQLNVYLQQNAQEKPAPRPDPQRDSLGFDAEEWTEINSRTFTPLDGFYLEECFLLRDAARSLGIDNLPKLKQAEAAFRWVTRQIRLRERRGEIVPPAFVLRRGYGTSLQRSQVFVALLQQLNLTGCLVAFPGKQPVVLPAVQDDKEIYLFDTRLGLALPGAAKNSILTLSQLRAKPELLAPLTVDAKHPYDIAPEAVQKAEVLVYYPLSAVAPRMRLLQRLLGPRIKVALAIDPEAVAKQLAEAGVTAKTTQQPGDEMAPVRALRVFLPRQEGGAGVQVPVDIRLIPGIVMPTEAMKVGWTRKIFCEMETVPWYALPPAIRELPAMHPLGAEARDRFRGVWVQLMGRTQEARARGPEEENPFAMGEEQAPRIKTVSDEDLPRTMILRGQTDKAREHLLKVLDALGEQRKIRQSEPKLDAKVDEWLHAVKGMYLRRDESSRAQIQAAWRQAPVLLLYIDALNAPLTAEARYAVALTNHERAARLEARAAAERNDAWQDTLEGWRIFVKSHAAHPAALAAHRLEAEALEAVGKTDAARDKWQNLGAGIVDNKVAPLTPLEKTACLFRAKQLSK
jgi:hypothetical protein